VVVLRTLLGDALRATRQRQHRTLREVSSAARVSLGYLSEVERGQKEASSELLASICGALGVRLSDVLREVSDELAVLEGPALVEAAPVLEPAREPVLAPAGSLAGRRLGPAPDVSAAA
jgi:transcriptional regulator with XRE-family HTH domain